MKKVLLFLSVSALLTIVSCGDDDDDGVQLGLTGAVTYNGSATTIANGLFGELTQQGVYTGFYFLSDGSLTFDTNSEQASSAGDLLITMSTFSVGDSFSPGEFTTDLTGDRGVLVAVLNESNAANGGDIATGGSVNVTGSGNVYTITFNLEFENDVTLTGTVTGGFEVLNLTGQ